MRTAITNNKKHTFMSGPSERYQKTTPEYLRTLDNPKNIADPTKAIGFNGTITVISKNQGWITIDPKNPDRKKPVEKYAVSDDATASSKLTPNWMQCQYPKNKSDFMKSVVPNTTNLREESNRTYLIDKVPPAKSIWSIGDIRHNVTSTEQAEMFSKQAQTSNIVRLMDWPDSARQNKAKVSHKIGSYHEN